MGNVFVLELALDLKIDVGLMRAIYRSNNVQLWINNQKLSIFIFTSCVFLCICRDYI